MRPNGNGRSATPTQPFLTAYQMDDGQEPVAVAKNREPPCHLNRLVADAESFRCFASQCRLPLIFASRCLT